MRLTRPLDIAGLCLKFGNIIHPVFSNLLIRMISLCIVLRVTRKFAFQMVWMHWKGVYLDGDGPTWILIGQTIQIVFPSILP